MVPFPPMILFHKLPFQKTKNPDVSPSGVSESLPETPQPIPAATHNLFSHPDYTVGSGISPDRPLAWFADSTAGRESHPAPKNLFLIYIAYYNRYLAENQGVFRLLYSSQIKFKIFIY